MRTNNSLDSRRWQQPKAERDDLPLFDVTHTTIVLVSEVSQTRAGIGRSRRSQPVTGPASLGDVIE